jgi:hypothetical protein
MIVNLLNSQYIIPNPTSNNHGLVVTRSLAAGYILIARVEPDKKVKEKFV